MISPNDCGCPCAPIASAPLPLPTVGGLCVRSGLPRRFAPPLPRRVALPLRGLLWRPAPSWAPLWRPLSLAAVLAPRALAVSAGPPRSLRARGLAAPSPVLPPAGGALLPLSPLSCGSLPLRVAAVLALLPPIQTPAHSPCPLAHPEGDFNRLGHRLSATAQNSPTAIPSKPPPTPPTPSHSPRGFSIGWVIFCRLPHYFGGRHCPLTPSFIGCPCIEGIGGQALPPLPPSFARVFGGKLGGARALCPSKPPTSI